MVMGELTYSAGREMSLTAGTLISEGFVHAGVVPVKRTQCWRYLEC
jgi:hypothetical protein